MWQGYDLLLLVFLRALLFIIVMVGVMVGVGVGWCLTQVGPATSTTRRTNATPTQETADWI